MNAVKILGFVVLLLLASCDDKDAECKCIDQKIQDFQSRTFCFSGSKVEQYSYQNVTIYVLKEGNCGADLQDEVLNANCENLGYLGGFTGNTTINGEAFSKAQFVTTLWVQ